MLEIVVNVDDISNPSVFFGALEDFDAAVRVRESNARWDVPEVPEMNTLLQRIQITIARQSMDALTGHS